MAKKKKRKETVFVELVLFSLKCEVIWACMPPLFCVVFFGDSILNYKFNFCKRLCRFSASSVFFLFVFLFFKEGCFFLRASGNYSFLFYFILFIYLLFMAVLGFRFCARALSSCGKWGPLFIAVRGPLTITASLVAEHRLQTHTGSAIVAHGPSCSAAYGILPDQGSNPCPLHWQADSQPLHHQGSPFSFYNLCLSKNFPVSSKFLIYWLKIAYSIPLVSF